MVLAQELDIPVNETPRTDSGTILEKMSESDIYVERAAAKIMVERINSEDNWSISPKQLMNQVVKYNASLAALHKLVTNEYTTEDEKIRARGLLAEVYIYTLLEDLEEFDILIEPGSAYNDINGIDFSVSVGDLMYHIDVTSSEWNELDEKYAQNHTMAIFPFYEDGKDSRVVPEGEKKDAFIEYATNQQPLAISAYSAHARIEILNELSRYNCTLANRHKNNPRWEKGALKSVEFWENVIAKLNSKKIDTNDSL